MMRLGNILVSDDGISELMENRPVMNIARDDIVSAKLDFVSGAQRPLVSLIAGLVFISIGFYPLIRLADIAVDFFSHGLVPVAAMKVFVYLIMFALFFGLLGGYLLHQALKKKWCIVIVGRARNEKAVLSGDVTSEDLLKFIQSAKEVHGIAIDAPSDDMLRLIGR